MDDIAFNLIDEPWIRVLNQNSDIEEVSIRTLLLHAHRYRAFSGELPTQDAAILRLLLAILHTVFSRVDETGEESPLEDEDQALERWKAIWDEQCFPETPISEYLNTWHERFWLFHPKRPFYQVAELGYGTEYESAKLNGEISESSNKLRMFSGYSGIAKDRLSYAQAARWLLYVNAYDDTSAKPSKEGKALAGDKLPSPGCGWLGKLGPVWASGHSVFEVLMRNLVLVNAHGEFNPERPIWEQDVFPSQERVQISPPDNLSELYTLQSRRLFLLRENDSVIGYRLLGGDFFDKEKIAFLEPMTVWNTKTDKVGNTTITPKRHDPSKQMWREFSSLFLGTKRAVPGVIHWNHRLAEEECLPWDDMLTVQIVSVQYGDKDFFVKQVFADQLTLHASLLSEMAVNRRTRIREEIEICERLAYDIAMLAKDLYIASGGSEKNSLSAENDAKTQLFYMLDIPFREWLYGIQADSDMENKVYMWRKQAKGIALRLGETMVNQAGEPAMRGHMDENRKFHSAPKAWRFFRAALEKRYQQGREPN